MLLINAEKGLNHATGRPPSQADAMTDNVKETVLTTGMSDAKVTVRAILADSDCGFKVKTVVDIFKIFRQAS